MSEVVAPNPVINPCSLPLDSVLCIHNTPRGPTGADTHIPINIPVSIISIIIIQIPLYAYGCYRSFLHPLFVVLINMFFYEL